MYIVYIYIYIYLYKSSLKFDYYYFITDGSLCLLYSIHSNVQIFLFPIKEPFLAEQLTKNLIQ
jgi:hypothetical protein